MIPDKSSSDFELPPDLCGALRGDALRRSDRSNEFWARQQTTIRARLISAEPTKQSRLRLALVAAGAAICVALLLDTPSDRQPAPRPVVQVDPDQALLQTIERSLAAGTPRALAPVALSNDSSHDANEFSNLNKEYRDAN